jgi:hypothetical protein
MTNDAAHLISSIPSDHFSLELYSETLGKAKSLGYEFPTVSEFKTGERPGGHFLLLRHDIDVSPRYALRMAELEQRLGVRSSYFVLLHSLYYNPAAPPHWDALRRIISMGFEVGLHYDTNFFANRGIDPLVGVQHDVAALENILDIEIVSVSQHRPASSTFLRKLNEHYVDAYNHHLMQDVRYVSDSGHKWRGETLMDILGKEQRIHALIHPVTWTFADCDMASTYRHASQEITGEIHNSFEEFITTTCDYLAKREQLDAQRKAQYAASQATSTST